MATQTPRRLLKPLAYTVGTLALGGGFLYISYRPRNIPGSDPAAVPLRFAADGTVAPPQFPKIKSRQDQIADLKRSKAIQQASEPGKGIIGGLFSSNGDSHQERVSDGDRPYDLLVIGGGATGAGIALDAATRGLKVAVVERDDFSSGTSSKSTKLVHGGVRYLEKAVWELDYNQ